MIDRKNSNKKLIKKKGKSPGNRSRKPASSATMAAYNKRNYISRGLGFELPEWLVNIFGTLDAPVRGRSFGQSSRQKSAFRINFRELVYYHRKKLYIISAVIAGLMVTAGLLFGVYRVKNVTIEGSYHYTNEEIYSFVLGDNYLGKSSIYLFFKYRNKEIENIPFIETMSVKITSPDSIRIVVYEKALAGFVEHMGRYFYFDKDGTIIESTNVKTKGIPQVLGLKFDHLVLYEKLPIEEEDIFREILEVTQLLNKYEMAIDKIYFDSNLDITLYFDEARVKLGNFDNIDEKMIRLKSILPELEGKKGVLRLENYTAENYAVSFEMD